MSVVTQVVEMLKREIQGGRWRTGLPGERDLGKLLQVSRTTIRTALAELARAGIVRRTTARRLAPVRLGAEERGGPNSVIAILTPFSLEQHGRFELVWLDALRELLAANGAVLQLVPSPRAFGPNATRTLAELTGQQPRATWVLLRSSRGMQEWFESRRLPAVIAGSRHEGIQLPCVEVDVAAAVRHAAHRLAALGHRRIAFFIEPTPAAGVSRSEEAFRSVAPRVQGLEVVHHGPSRDEFLNVLTRRFAAAEAPTGLLVERYTHALTALTWLLANGVRWPGPIALLSREDTSSFDHTTPGVSSYQFDASLFARKMARLVVELAYGGVLHGSVHRVQPKLIRRETA